MVTDLIIAGGIFVAIAAIMALGLWISHIDNKNTNKHKRRIRR